MNYKSVFNVIKNYHWQSLFFKYWKILILAFAVPMIIFFFVFFGLYNSSQQSEFNQSFVASALKSKSEFDLVANNLENYYNAAITDSNVVKFLNSANPEPVNIDNYELHTLLTNHFSAFKANNPYVDSIFIYSQKSDYVVSTRTSNYRDSFQYADIVNNCLADNRHITTSVINTNEHQKIQCLTIAYPLCLNHYSHADGLLIININCNALAEYISSAYIYEDLLLFTNDVTPLAEVDGISETALTSYIEIYKANLDEINSMDYYIKRTKNSILCYVPIKDLEMTMVLHMPSENTKNLINSFALTLTALGIIMLLIILSISFYTSLVLYKSIANIISEIGIAPMPGDENENEANFISNNFLSTLKSHSNVEKELTEKIQLLKKSQTLALQTQINPHFIFNTLNLVNLMIMRITQENCAPAQIISLLSDIMFYSLKTDKFITSLDEELAYTRKYIQIEQIKYNNQFNFNFDIDESVKDCKIVKFTLQPILENCVEHGIKKLKDRKGMIQLKVFKDKELLHIVITDNGTGITPQKLEELNAKLISSEIPTGKHIGLANVNQRIQLIFGSEYGVKVIPLTQGLKIELTQPLS
ncbi:MAG: histidine kinase [Clostridia bacterium]|nr:histidine kinase [Clostridia bacterium]